MHTSPLTKHDAVSTVPGLVRGDWVLFHPVYSPEELRAVEVSSIFILKDSLSQINVSGSPSSAKNT